MLYLVDKPVGISSFDVIRTLRKKFGIKKMGHAGTLDPLASGCMIVATENSTKLLSLLDTTTKTYEFTVDISIQSDSLDLGTPTRTMDCSSMFSPGENVIRGFLEGQVDQVPPRYSALHINGTRAYDLARAGTLFDIAPRTISVREVEVLSIELPRITLRMTLSSGGYIRSFAPLIGGFCGVPGGGCVTSLRRVAIGELDISRFTHLEDITVDDSVPYLGIFPGFGEVWIDSSHYDHLRNGRSLNVSRIPDIHQELVFTHCHDITALMRKEGDSYRVVKNFL